MVVKLLKNKWIIVAPNPIFTFPPKGHPQQ